MEFTGSYYSENKKFRPTDLLNQDHFQSGVVLYEVLRIYNNTALFLEDHLRRLQNSIHLSGYTYQISMGFFHDILSELCSKNRLSMGNVKIISFFQPGHEPVIYTFFIPHSYPLPEMYENGTEADFFKAERTNPNIKKMHPDLIQKISVFIKNRNIYDALLVDELGFVTEGSKTNLFFIKNDDVFTAPGERVLK